MTQEHTKFPSDNYVFFSPKKSSRLQAEIPANSILALL